MPGQLTELKEGQVFVRGDERFFVVAINRALNQVQLQNAHSEQREFVDLLQLYTAVAEGRLTYWQSNTGQSAYAPIVALSDTSLSELSKAEFTFRLSAVKEVERLLEQLAQGSLKVVNANIPTKLGDLLFDRVQVKLIVGNSHDVAMLTAEQLSRMTGWKSESIRHWIKSGLLVGEEGQLRGRPVYWVAMRAVHQFMCDYKTVSELAGLLGTSPKAVSERLKALGVPILGTMQVALGVMRGGLVALKDVLFSGLSPKQAQLFDVRGGSNVTSLRPVSV